MSHPEDERERIAGKYSLLSDEELEKLAQNEQELSETARETLRAEAMRRGLALSTDSPGFDVWELNKAVTVAKFRDLPEALLAKGSLDSAGITSHLVDDNMIRMDWFYSNLLGGIKIKVLPEDVESATEILNQPIPPTLEVEGFGEYEQPRCPNCQSLDVNFRELDKLVSFGSAYLGIPIPVERRAWICHNCHTQWEEAPSGQSEAPPYPS